MGSHDVSNSYIPFQPLLVSPLGLPCIPTPRLLETTTTCFGSDRYGMLEAWKHITWFIHCSRADKWPDIERKEVDVFAL